MTFKLMTDDVMFQIDRLSVTVATLLPLTSSTACGPRCHPEEAEVVRGLTLFFCETGQELV